MFNILTLFVLAICATLGVEGGGMSLLGSKGSFTATRMPDVGDYAGFSEAWSFWDGIRNVGVSSPHDNTSNTWCDLARNDSTLTLDSTMSFADKGLQTVSSKGVYIGGSGTGSNYFSGAAAINELTYECAISYSAFTEDSTNMKGGIVGCDMLYKQPIIYGEPWGVRYYMWAEAQGNYAYNASSDIAQGFMSFAGVWSASQGFIKFYINGEMKKSVSIANDWVWGGTDAATAHFNRGYFEGYGLTGTYHRMSIVKRAMTDAELTKNYKIDRKRFAA